MREKPCTSPDIGPGTESDQSQPHGEVCKVRQWIQAQEAHKPRDKVEKDSHNNESGRRFERFENIFALVLSPEVGKLLLDFLHDATRIPFLGYHSRNLYKSGGKKSPDQDVPCIFRKTLSLPSSFAQWNAPWLYPWPASAQNRELLNSWRACLRHRWTPSLWNTIPSLPRQLKNVQIIKHLSYHFRTIIGFQITQYLKDCWLQPWPERKWAGFNSCLLRHVTNMKRPPASIWVLVVHLLCR